MDLTERDFEMAAQATGIEVSAAVMAAQAALSGPGSDECEDCSQPIPARRRAAMPSATRCVHCQTIQDKHTLLFPGKH
jgi:phage/conjugal plasmid C-4 type zinc finger TraR family protein